MKEKVLLESGCVVVNNKEEYEKLLNKYGVGMLRSLRRSVRVGSIDDRIASSKKEAKVSEEIDQKGCSEEVVVETAGRIPRIKLKPLKIEVDMEDKKKKVYAMKNCKRCNNLFNPIGPRSEYCEVCKPSNKKAVVKKEKKVVVSKVSSIGVVKDKLKKELDVVAIQIANLTERRGKLEEAIEKLEEVEELI